MPLFFFILGMILAVIHIYKNPANKQKHRTLEIILLYYLIFTIGITGFFAAYAQIFMASDIAKSIGWPVGNPFETEVAMANLAFGVMGILCIWIREKFWLATIVGSSVFLFGDGIGHLVQMAINKDYAPNNSGLILYTDLFFPIFGLILYFFYDHNLKKVQQQTTN